MLSRRRLVGSSQDRSRVCCGPAAAGGRPQTTEREGASSFIKGVPKREDEAVVLAAADVAADRMETQADLGHAKAHRSAC